MRLVLKCGLFSNATYIQVIKAIPIKSSAYFRKRLIFKFSFFKTKSILNETKDTLTPTIKIVVSICQGEVTQGAI